MESLREQLINKYFGSTEIVDIFDYQKQLSKIGFKLSIDEQLALLPFIKIDENKLLIISDTHFGGIYDNYKYIDMIYDFAAKYGYNNILHGGDLIQGDIPITKDGYNNANMQAVDVIASYPYDKNINNYILLGNHDCHIYRNMFNSLNILKQREDLKLLGIRYAYINWYNHLVSISHHVKKKKYKLDYPKAESFINFHGHRHELHIIESHVFLPTLSDDIKRYNQAPNYPGFLTGTIEGDEVYINSYIFDDNNIVDKGLVLQRKDNERVRIK